MNIQVPTYVSRLAALALLSAPLMGPQLHAEEVYSQIVGAIALDIPAESDVVVAFPFKQSASYGGPVSSVSGSTVDIGAPALTAGSFDAVGGEATYFLLVESGDLQGRRFDVASNTASAITLDTSDDLSSLTSAIITVREHWTLGEAFPNGVGGIDELEPARAQIKLILPERVSQGGGLSAAEAFYFHQNAWREVGEPLDLSTNGANANGATIEPGTSVMIRNNGDEDVRTYFFGEVVTAPLAIPVVSSAAEIIDNFVSVERPLGLALSELGLGSSSVFTASTGLDEGSREDLLLVYSASAKDESKVASQYFFYNSNWYLVGGDGSPVNDTVISAGQAIAIRKKAGTDATNYWINTWSLD